MANIFRILVLLAALSGAGCSVKYVADYDATTVDALLTVSKEVDVFYGTLLDTRPESRAYTAYSAKYISIEADLRSLWMRNKARALNKESTTIARDILDLWIKYKTAHKQDNAYSDAKAEAHRNRFERMFASALTAETAKKTTGEDVP